MELQNLSNRPFFPKQSYLTINYLNILISLLGAITAIYSTMIYGRSKSSLGG